MMLTLTLRRFGVFFLLSAALILASCDDFEGDQEIPAYIHIDSIAFEAGFGQGSSSHKITDAWVYIDGELIGAFQLPVNVPVLKKGSHELMIKAGIKLNGISSTRVNYPFYAPYYQDIVLTEDSITRVSPQVEYYSTTKFPWIESFESGGVSMEQTTDSDTILMKTNAPADVFEGNYSGVVYLDDSATYFEAATISAYTLPTSGKAVFLELDYLINNPITIGVIGQGGGQIIQTSVMYIYENTKWNKMYINLTPTIMDMGNSTEFKIFIGAVKLDGVSNPKMMIDNIKLLHF